MLVNQLQLEAVDGPQDVLPVPGHALERVQRLHALGHEGRVGGVDLEAIVKKIGLPGKLIFFLKRI